jgi:hypothetical protein
MGDDDRHDEFWRRTTQRENLALYRKYERERRAVGWRRNLLGALVLALLLWTLWFLLRR